MVKKVARVISIIVLVLTGLSLFGYWLQKALIEDSDSALVNGVKEFVALPGKVEEVVTSNEIQNVPPTFEVDHHIEKINSLPRDVFGINSFYDVNQKIWEIWLFNFRNDSVLHKWVLNRDSFVKTDRLYPNAEPRNPILLPERNVIAVQDESRNLYRLDKESNVVWHNTERRFHHSLNLDANGSIWVCSTKPRLVKTANDSKRLLYEDEILCNVDTETGKIIREYSVVDMFIDNGYPNFVYGFSNNVDYNEKLIDPLHLNDIEPVLQDGPYWKKGDLLLSFRHRSLVVLYRPSTGRILKLIFGPFINQHDVDIVNDSTISIFNNAGTSLGRNVGQWDQVDKMKTDSIDLSSIIQFDFSNSKFSTRYLNHFKKHDISTRTQGLHHRLSDGLVYVEQHNAGIMLFMDDERIYYRSQGPNRIPNWVERPHWIRIYENVEF